MIFIFSVLGSYFLSALAIILDKFLLGSKRISSAPVYSFYIGVLGLFALFFIPFGFNIPSVYQILISLLGGCFFSYGILFLYFAIQKGEASRVSPIIGAIIPVITFFLSFIFLDERLVVVQIAGVIFLILGGLLISFDLPLKINKRKFFAGFYPAVFSGILLSVAYFLFKFVYEEQSFVNGFIWTRFGCALAIFSYFLVPNWRKDIISSFKNFRKPKKESYQTGGLFVANKILGGIGSILLNFSISLGSVTLVNSLVSSQYVFVLILAYGGHLKFPSIFKEKLGFWDWMQKIGAIVLIGTGVWLVFK